ncbi:hypothetical protein ACIBEJ_34655 [Nonomuraea sp. NPDC050790]|uniref:hypothetical protein n=1 Tax=Nonomuraea sp. NPDC050790 TaxID=3364371 RepID=UPI00378ECB86
MGREVKRVALDFGWPLKKVWQGFLMPDRLREDECPDCTNGYSAHAQHLQDLWYGYVPFTPADNGSTSFSEDTPAVWAFAERNVSHAPEYYGVGESAIRREARRLARLWNGQWSHHLNDDDVAALVEADRLYDLTHTWAKGDGWRKKNPPVIPTAEQVNEWSLLGFGHDSINAYVVIRARCAREGVADTCATCEGYGSVEAYQGQRAEAEAWERAEPPAGEGWQLWETVSEGSPMSPVCASAEDLAAWMSQNPCLAGDESPSFETALAFVHVGWAPTLAGSGGRVVDGVTAVAEQAEATS